jgi:hypothetical protein
MILPVWPAMPERPSAQYWRYRAERARKMAAKMKDEVARFGMLEIGRHYDILAENADIFAKLAERERPASSPTPSDGKSS